MACWAMMQSLSLRCSASVSSCVHGEIASNTRLSCVASFGRPLKFVALKSGGHKNRKGFPPRVVTATLGLEESSDGVTAATIDCNVVEKAIVGEQGQSVEVDTVTEAELKENGFRSTRRTNLICTIDPATCALEQLEALAMGGMNVARLNMCHGTREWHTQVICNVRSLNSEKGYSVAIMMDTEGSEIHVGDFNGAPSVKAKDGEEWIFTVRKLETLPDYTAIVNYDGFAEDVRVGDELVVDGGMVRFEVKEKVGLDVKCKCIDPGLLLPRANLTFWREGPLVREQGVKKGVRLQAYFDPGCNEARHAPPVKSFTMSDGTCIDCIPIEGQIAAHHPSLQDHVIQMPPSQGPWRPSESHPQAFAREHGGCPEGTIPVLRDDPMGKFMQKVAPPWKAPDPVVEGTPLWKVPVPVSSENPALGADTAKHEYAITNSTNAGEFGSTNEEDASCAGTVGNTVEKQIVDLRVCSRSRGAYKEW